MLIFLLYHQVVLMEWSLLTISHHPSLSFIAPKWSSRQHPVSADLRVGQHWCVHVPESTVSYEFVFSSLALSSTSHIRRCRLSEMEGSWPHNCCFVECGFQNLFKTAYRILFFQSSFFSKFFVRILGVQPYSSIDTAITSKKYHFILSERSDFHIIDNLTMAVNVFSWHHFQLMRYCYRGMWIGQLISEVCHLV